jgi:hypothetical protein
MLSERALDYIADLEEDNMKGKPIWDEFLKSLEKEPDLIKNIISEELEGLAIMVTLHLREVVSINSTVDVDRIFNHFKKRFLGK